MTNITNIITSGTTGNPTVIGVIKTDVKAHSIVNVIRGWATSIFIGVPFILMAILLPFKYDTGTMGVIELTYDPEWYIRLFFVFFGLLALLAPNKVPTTVTTIFDVAKNIAIKKAEQ
jgi:hypothetical protein